MSDKIDKTQIMVAMMSGFFGLLTSMSTVVMTHILNNQSLPERETMEMVEPGVQQLQEVEPTNIILDNISSILFVIGFTVLIIVISLIILKIKRSRRNK